MKETLSKLYQLQVLADQLMTTHKRADELKKLRELNDSDYHSLHRLLNQQTAGLDEALRLKKTIYREMHSGCREISRIKRAQNLQTKKIDFRSEVHLDKQLTKYQNTLSVKFRELNQLLWQLGEPLHHPTYLHAHLNGFLELQELLEIERDLQLVFAGYDLSEKANKSEETVEAYLQRRCSEGAALIKKIGGSVRFNVFLTLSESECTKLAEDGYTSLIAEDQETLESKLTPIEEKRILRDKIQSIQAHFAACARSYAKINGGEPRPKNYDELLSEASLVGVEEMKSALKDLMPFTIEGRPELSENILTDQFDIDYSINPNGFIQVFQEKFDRLTDLRLKMDRVEELQERELNNEAAKVSNKEKMRQEIIKEFNADPKIRRYYKQYHKISEVRDLYAVAYVKRPAEDVYKSFSYENEFFCSGCNVVISSALHQQVRKLAGLQLCDSCNRILVPFAHVTHIKEEVDPLLVNEEERIAMEESGDLGLIPACSNCNHELYADGDLKTELEPSEDCSMTCPGCYSFLVPINIEEEVDAPSTLVEESSALEEEA